MNYIEMQNKVIADYSITHSPISNCWSRMHAHIKERKVCKHNIKESYKSLFDLLHEIGHIETDVSGMKRAEQESEATKWAIKLIKELGLTVKRKVVQSYKDYIKMTYDRGIRRGLTKNIKSKLLM